MNGRKKIIIIMIVLFGLLMTTGVSTWIITSQVTFAPGFLEQTELTVTPKEIDINYTSPMTTGDLETAIQNLINPTFTKVGNDGREEEITLIKDTDYTVSLDQFTDNNVTVKSTDKTKTAVAVGSTYLCTMTVTLAPKMAAYKLKESNLTFIARYNTCNVGGNWFTIEKALAEKGDITIAGSDTSGKAQTTFSLLSIDDDAYSDDKKYILDSNATLKVPYNAAGTEYGEGEAYADKIYSALTIPSTVTLTVNGTITIGANFIAGNSNVGKSYNRGVILNNGNIELNANSKLNCYGFLMGGGTVKVKSGATVLDVMRAYDWRGGTASTEMSGKVFPFCNYTIHNNSCFTTIEHGGIYEAVFKTFLDAKIMTMWLHETVCIVGTSTTAAMFVLEENGYIEKTTSSPGSSISQNNSNISYGSNLYNRDKLTIYGNCKDSSISLKKTVLGAGVDITTGVNYPLPIGYMDVEIGSKDGTKTGLLTLNEVSYNVLPTATICVNKNSTINVSNGVNVVFADYAAYSRIHEELDTNSKGGKGDMLSGASSTTPAKFEIYGTVNFFEGTTLGGKIVAGEADGAKLNMASGVGLNPTITLNNDETYTELKATGDFIYYKIGENAAVTSKTVGGSSTIFEANNTYVSFTEGEAGYWAKQNIAVGGTATLPTTDGEETTTVEESIESGETLTAEILSSLGYNPIYTAAAVIDGADLPVDGTVKIYSAFNVTAFDLGVPKYHITYNFNGGILNSAAEKQVKTIAGEDETITLGYDSAKREIVPVYEGADYKYELLGWAKTNENKQEDIITTLNTAEGTSDFTTDSEGNSVATVYAVWNRLHRIVYDANGGELTAAHGDVYVDLKEGDYTLTEASPTRDGFRFIGWAFIQTEDGGYVNLNENDYKLSVALSDIGSGYDKTVYAVWEQLEIVVFDGNGGTITKAPESVLSITISGTQYYGTLPLGATYAIPAATEFTVTYNDASAGKRFIGWAETADATVAATSVDINKKTTTLYAVWEGIYTVYYYDKDNVAQVAKSVDFAGGENYTTLSTLTGNQADLIGWTKEVPDTENGGTMTKTFAPGDLVKFNDLTTDEINGKAVYLTPVWKDWPTVEWKGNTGNCESITVSSGGDNINSGGKAKSGNVITVTIKTNITVDYVGSYYMIGTITITSGEGDNAKTTTISPSKTKGDTTKPTPDPNEHSATVTGFQQANKTGQWYKPTHTQAFITFTFVMPDDNVTINITTNGTA